MTAAARTVQFERFQPGEPVQVAELRRQRVVRPQRSFQQ